MIWYPTSEHDSDNASIVSHISEQIKSACGKDLPLSSDNIDEIARAVACYLQENNCSTVDSEQTAFLASRALSSMGEETVARRLVVFWSGLIKPSEWEISDGEDMWILDLKQLTVDTASRLEMIFYQGLFIVLDSIADLWEESQGTGILGLRHVCSTAESFLKGATKKRNDDMSREIIGVCLKKMDQISKERGWLDTPRLMNLDIK